MFKPNPPQTVDKSQKFAKLRLLCRGKKVYVTWSTNLDLLPSTGGLDEPWVRILYNRGEPKGSLIMEKIPNDKEMAPELPPEVEEAIRRDAEADGMDPDEAVKSVREAAQEELE